MIAAKLLEQGQMEDGQIAALLAVTTQAVDKKRKAFQEGGRRVLCSSGSSAVPGFWTLSSACICGRC